MVFKTGLIVNFVMKLHRFLAGCEGVTQSWSLLFPLDSLMLIIKSVVTGHQLNLRLGISLTLIIADLSSLVILDTVQTLHDILTNIIVVSKLAVVAVSTSTFPEVEANLFTIEHSACLLFTGDANMFTQKFFLLVLLGSERIAEH